MQGAKVEIELHHVSSVSIYVLFPYWTVCMSQSGDEMASCIHAYNRLLAKIWFINRWLGFPVFFPFGNVLLIFVPYTFITISDLDALSLITYIRTRCDQWFSHTHSWWFISIYMVAYLVWWQVRWGSRKHIYAPLIEMLEIEWHWQDRVTPGLLGWYISLNINILTLSLLLHLPCLVRPYLP
jgi:hypothetical protein